MAMMIDTLLWQLIKTATCSRSNSAPAQTYLIRAYDTDLYWTSPEGDISTEIILQPLLTSKQAQSNFQQFVITN